MLVVLVHRYGEQANVSVTTRHLPDSRRLLATRVMASLADYQQGIDDDLAKPIGWADRYCAHQGGPDAWIVPVVEGLLESGAEELQLKACLTD